MSYIIVQSMQTYGGKLATFKLHCAARHIPDQLRCCGPGAHVLEFWIERMVGYMKEDVRARVRQFPEVTFVKGHLLRTALMSMRSKYPEHCLTIDEFRKAGRKMPFPAYDELQQADSGNVLLLGKRADGAFVWRALSASEPAAAAYVSTAVAASPAPLTELDLVLSQLPRAIKRSPQDYAQQGWPIVLESALFEMHEEGSLLIDKFLRCSLTCSDLMSCEQDHSQPTSDNRWAYLEHGEGEPCVAQVQCFVRVAFAPHAQPVFARDCIDAQASQETPLPASHPRGSDGRLIQAQPLRFAIVKLWRLAVVDTSAIGGRVEVDPVTLALPDLFFVDNIGENGPCAASGSSQQAGSVEAEQYLGVHMVDATALQSQLVPTKPFSQLGKQSRFFMTVNKSSGR